MQLLKNFLTQIVYHFQEQRQRRREVVKGNIKERNGRNGRGERIKIMAGKKQTED